MLTPRQDQILRMVVETYAASGQPVGSKALAAAPELDCGPSTIRNELAILEEQGLLAHPHTSAGRVPTDAGHRYFVDRLLPVAPRRDPELALELTRREVDEAMRMTTETLSQVTSLLAIVSAPPLDTSTVHHVEVLALQPQVVMVVVITSTGGVTKRVVPFDEPVDTGLVSWAGEYLNERLSGMGLGARMLHGRLADPSLDGQERAFVEALSPAFTELAATATETISVTADAPLVDLGKIEQGRTLSEAEIKTLVVEVPKDTPVGTPVDPVSPLIREARELLAIFTASAKTAAGSGRH